MVAGVSRNFQDAFPLVKGQEQQWQLMMIASLQALDAYEIALGFEESPEEPPVDAPEEERERFDKDSEDYLRRSRLGKSLIARSLTLNQYTQGKASRILRMENLPEIWKFGKTSFIIKTERSVEQARRSYEECSQKPHEQKMFLKINKFNDSCQI